MKSSVRLSSLLAEGCSSASGVQSCPKGPLQNGEGWISMVYSATLLFHPLFSCKKKKKKGGERRAMLYISARNVLSYQHKLGKALTVFQDKCREHGHKAFSVEHTHTHTRTWEKFSADHITARRARKCTNNPSLWAGMRGRLNYTRESKK